MAEWEELPTETEEGKEITYYRAESKDPKVTGYSIIDPKTGTKIGEIASTDIGRWSQPTSVYRGKGMTFRKLEPTPEVKAKIERLEEKKAPPTEIVRDGKTVERYEVPPKSSSETWEDYIEKYGTEAKVPSTYIAKKYEEEFKEAAREEAEEEAKVTPTTKEEFVAALTAKQVRVQTQEVLFEKQYELTKGIPYKELTDSQKQLVLQKEPVYTTGGIIPEKTAEIKRYGELTPEERVSAVQLPSPEITTLQAKDLYTERAYPRLYEPRIIGKDTGISPRVSPDILPSEKEKIRKLEEFAERIKKTEKAREKLGIEKGLGRIQEFSRFITGGRPFAAGVVSTAIGFPFYGLAVAARVPEITLKTAALGAGMIIPSARKLTIEESRRAFGIAKETVKEVVTTPEGLGFLVTIPLIGMGMKYVKSPISIKTYPAKEGKVTLVKIRGKKPFKAALQTKERLILIKKGEMPPPPPTGMIPLAERAITPRPTQIAEGGLLPVAPTPKIYKPILERVPLSKGVKPIKPRVKYTKLSDIPQRDVVIKSAKQFEQIRSSIHKEIGYPKVETRFSIIKEKVFGGKIEPQVSKAVKTLNKKGYETYSSGFAGGGSILAGKSRVGVQTIEFKGRLSQDVIRKLKTSGITVSMSYGNTIITIDQKGKSLTEVKRIFDKATEIIPTKAVLPSREVKLFRAGDISPSVELAKGKDVYGFTTRELAEGWKIKQKKKAVYEIETTKIIKDTSKAYARPVPSIKRPSGYKMITSTKPEFIIKGIKAERIVGEPSLKLRKKEVMRRAGERTILDIKEGIIKPVPETPAKLRRIFRKEIIQKRGIKPLEIPPSVLEKPPKPLDIEIIKPPTPKKARKIARKEIVQARGIKPLDISPKGIFQPIKKIPLYEPPSVLKVRKKEAIERARKKTIEEVRTGLIPIKEVRPSIRKAVRKEITREVKWGIEKKRVMGKRVPKELYFDIKRLPMAYWWRTKIEKPVLRKIYPKRKPTIPKRLEVVTPSGQVLILKKPIVITTKVKIAKQKLVSKALAEAKPKYPSTEKVAYSALEKYYPRREVSVGERISTVLGRGRFPKMRGLTGLFVIPRGAMAKLGRAVGRKVTPIKKIGLISKQVQVPISKQKIISAQAQLQRQAQISLLALDTVQAQESIQELTPVQERVQLQERVIDISKPITTVPPLPSPPPPPPPPLIPPSRKTELMKEIKIKTKQRGYDVLVKRKQLKKGKGSYESRGYRKANPYPLTRPAALGMMASILDTYTNRSGKIKQAKKNAIQRKDLETKWRILRHKFRMAKKKKAIVEKTAFAIDSFQEKQGIPYEAARLRRLGLIQTKSNFLKQKKKQNQLLNLITVKKKQQQINFLKTTKKKRGNTIKFL